MERYLVAINTCYQKIAFGGNDAPQKYVRRSICRSNEIIETFDPAYYGRQLRDPATFRHRVGLFGDPGGLYRPLSMISDFDLH